MAYVGTCPSGHGSASQDVCEMSVIGKSALHCRQVVDPSSELYELSTLHGTQKLPSVAPTA